MTPSVLTRLAGVAVAFLIGSALVLAAASPVSAMDTEKVGIDAQAWYITPVTACTLPIGCPPEPAPQSVSLYPKGTLHIAVDGGQPAAHAYLKPDLTSIPAGANLRAGTMTLPVTQDLPFGNVRVESAAIVGCLITEPIIEGVEGGITEPPAYDCEQASSPAKLRKDAKSFTLDLAPFLRMWSAGTPALGIALVPAPGQASDANWQVTFNGKGTEATPRISATISYASTVENDGTDPLPPAGAVTAPPPIGGVDAAPPAVPEIGEAPEAPSPPPLPAGEPPAPEISPDSQADVARLVNTPWYSYGGVVYLPLVLVAAIAIIARSLTRPLKPKPLRA